MSCCCTKTYKFCQKISGCSTDNIAFLFKGIPDGNYIIELDYLNSLVRIQMGVVGTTFTIVGPGLNESYIYTGKLFNIDGQSVPFIVNTITYDCFQFQTIMVSGFAGDIDSGSDAPPVTIGDVVEAIQWYNVIGEIPTGIIDGSNATFTTAFDFAIDVTPKLAVYVNGLLQEYGVHYTTTGNHTIIFNDSPHIGDIVECDYIKL